MSPLRLHYAEDVLSSLSRSSPQWHAEQAERLARVAPGIGDRFSGYAVVGVRFSNGHVLVLRRWPASSIGPAYTSVWHQSPDHQWHMFVNAGAGQTCVRYFPSMAAKWREERIRLCWLDPYRLRVEVRGAGLEWEIEFRRTWLTRIFGAVRSILPFALASSRPSLLAMQWMADHWLGAGRVPLLGVMPNGSAFRAVPRELWLMEDSRAWINGESLGAVDRSNVEVSLESYRVVTSGLLALVSSQFSSVFPQARELGETSGVHQS